MTKNFWNFKGIDLCREGMALLMTNLYVLSVVRCVEGACDEASIGKFLHGVGPDAVRPGLSLKTLTSLNKDVRPFFLSDNSIWRIPSVSSLSDYSMWRS